MKFKIEQFYDKQLAHASYLILSEGEIALIDPGRNPNPYYEFAQAHHANIVAVIETHPHADFVSSHYEIAKATGATIYVSELVGATYPHETFDDGDIITIGKTFLRAINTPGHSPDSICVLLSNEEGTDLALFTGDTLFIGDVGRPDLRENAGNITATKRALALQMFHSTRERIMPLPKHIAILPAHGAGSLCGKNLSENLSSTLEEQLQSNYALQEMEAEEFVNILLAEQPFIPKYFGYNVDLNKKGACGFEASIAQVPQLPSDTKIKENDLVIDVRPQEEFKKGHIKSAINIQVKGKFETWLGSIVAPGENFYLVGSTTEEVEMAVKRAAKIGYESYITGTIVNPENCDSQSPSINMANFEEYLSDYTILDVRNPKEAENKIFESAIQIPLYELRERIKEIPTDKPVVVHCAGGSRSAVGASILQHEFCDEQEVFDLSEAVKAFNSKITNTETVN